MSANQLLSLAAFLAMSVTAFKRLRPGEPPVRLFSLQSVPFAFLFWIALIAGAWIALAPNDIQNAQGVRPRRHRRDNPGFAGGDLHDHLSRASEVAA